VVSGQLHAPAALPPAPITRSAVSCNTKPMCGLGYEIVQCCVVGCFGDGAGRKVWWEALSFIRNVLYCTLLKLCAFIFVSTLCLGCLRRIFGPKRNEVTGEWRKVHNVELNDLYSSPSIVRMIKSRRMRWAGHIARMGERRGVYRVLVGKTEGKGPLGKPRRRWEDNIKMDLQIVGFAGMDWIELA